MPPEDTNAAKAVGQPLDTSTVSPAAALPSPEFLFKEISLVGGTIYKAAGVPDYNPDELVGKKGLEIYKKMMDDDQVKAVLTMKKYARLMSPWSVDAVSEDPLHKEQAQFVRDNLDRMEGTFEENLLNILTALEYGFSVTEEIWYQIERGRWSGKIGLRALKTRQPFYYWFDSDEFGNLRPDGIIYTGGVGIPAPVISAPTTASWLVPSVKTGLAPFGYRLPVNKFIVYSYNREFSNWYGKSDLRAAYRSWWSKEVLIRFMNIYMERFGMPTHLAHYPKGMRKEDRDAIKDILDKVQAKYSIVVPDDMKIELLEAAGAGEQSFKTAVEMHNRFMARSILVPDLMGFTEVTGGGSYALGKKHFDVFLWVIKKLGKDIEENIVNEQLIKRLIDLNYPNVEKYPQFRFEDITEEGTQTKAMIIAAGIQGGFIDPREPWIRRYLSLPELTGGFTLPSLTDISTTGGGTAPEVGPGRVGATTDTSTGLEQGTDTGLDTAGELSRFIEKLKSRYFSPPTKRKTVVSIPSKGEKKLKSAKYDSKLNYAQVKDDLNNFEDETVMVLSDIMKRQKEALFKDIQKKRIFEDNKKDEIPKLQLKYVGDFKAEMASRLFKVYLDSKVGILKELSGTGIPIQVKMLFQAGATVYPWEPVPPTEAIDFMKRKVLATIEKKDGKRKFIDLATGQEADLYDKKAFAITGIAKEDVLSQAKDIVTKGVESGNYDEAKFNLESLFEAYIAKGDIEDGVVSPSRLELIVRQNIAEAMNAGRKTMMRDVDVIDFIPYWQYTAILDDRVRDTHAEMHGRIYRSDDPIWDMIYPPNGFNCRCAVVGITMPEVEEADGGIEVSDYALPPGFPDENFAK